jgi:plastocyanin
MRRFHRSIPLFFALAAAACGGADKPATAEQSPAGIPATADAAAATGDTIIVEMHSDATGNYYKPNDIEAHKGDVVRFVLKSGVHNVNFLPDSNEIKTGLPSPSEMLQLPDQTYDLVVSMLEGHYYFHCDPHAALGMKGKLEVEDE